MRVNLSLYLNIPKTRKLSEDERALEGFRELWRALEGFRVRAANNSNHDLRSKTVG